MEVKFSPEMDGLTNNQWLFCANFRELLKCFRYTALLECVNKVYSE